jgi:uncharacterized membrane protein YqjE
MAIAERSISTVLHDIVSNVQDIVRSEIRLAKSEITEEAGKASSAAVVIGAAVLMLAFGMVFALLAVFFALSAVMPQWAAALIIAVGESAVAAILLGVGIKRLKSVRAAPKTAATLKENIEWAKQPTR